MQQHYDEVRGRATAEGRLAALEQFEELAKESVAVINTDLEFLYPFLTNTKMLQASYSLGVKGQLRKPADPDDDRARRTVEAMLFGLYAEEIRYAVLSLDGAGLSSYGPFTLRLRDIAIARRASLLDENSYDFVETHNIRPRKPVVPYGHRSIWGDRHVLAVAKLGDQIKDPITDEECARVLLATDGDRSKDEFIEVHIYGTFDGNAVESVRGSSVTKNKRDLATIARIKDVLAKSGRCWVEA